MYILEEFSFVLNNFYLLVIYCFKVEFYVLYDVLDRYSFKLNKWVSSGVVMLWRYKFGEFGYFEYSKFFWFGLVVFLWM